MAEKAKKTRKPHRADDKRNSGFSDNVPTKVRGSEVGRAKPLVGVMHDRRGDAKNGKGKRAK